MDVTPSATILDVIESNFEAVKAKSYVLRAIFIGEHGFQKPTVLNDYFKKVVQEVNSSYFDVPVKGCAIIYRKYYIAIIEGSEETVTRQINLLFAKDIDGSLRGRSKLLIVYHNILKRLSVIWQSVFADHNDLVTNINFEVDLKFQYEFLEKIIYKIDQAYRIFERQEDNTSKVGIADTNLKIYPENNDLDTILNFEFIMDLKEYAAMYETLPDYTYSFEKCWPTPYDFTPRRYYDDFKIKDAFIEQLPVELDLRKDVDVLLKELGDNTGNEEATKLPEESQDSAISYKSIN